MSDSIEDLKPLGILPPHFAKLMKVTRMTGYNWFNGLPPHPGYADKALKYVRVIKKADSMGLLDEYRHAGRGKQYALLVAAIKAVISANHE